MKTYLFPALIIAALLGHAGFRLATAEAFVFTPNPPVQVESAAGIPTVSWQESMGVAASDEQLPATNEVGKKLLADS